MAENTEILLQRFKTKRAEKDSTSLQEARRLVNLYRSLSCFGDDFVEKYNEMLLAVKPNVRRLLSTFMGGKEVEEYLEFLEQNAHLSASETDATEMQTGTQTNKGYLPDPEADIAVQKTSLETVSIPKSEWQAMQSQRENLVKQTQELLSVLKGLEGKSSPVSQTQKQEMVSPMTKPSSFDTYSEILEDVPGRKTDE